MDALGQQEAAEVVLRVPAVLDLHQVGRHAEGQVLEVPRPLLTPATERERGGTRSFPGTTRLRRKPGGRVPTYDAKGPEESSGCLGVYTTLGSVYMLN